MIPCCAGASPVAIDVSAVAVVDGHDGRDRAARHAASVGHERRVLLHRVPARAVEHEQDDRVGGRAPVRAATTRRARPRSAGTRPATDAPSSAGRTASSASGDSSARERRRRPGRPRDDGAMKVSTRGDYAARALLSLALHGTERPTSVKEIAERTHLPQPYLEQILLSVKGAGLVRSKRGVGGGYVLARPPEEITLADIVAAVEGPQLPMAEHPDHCEGHCILQEVWVGVDEETRRVLERVTLARPRRAHPVGHPERRRRQPR